MITELRDATSEIEILARRFWTETTMSVQAAGLCSVASVLSDDEVMRKAAARGGQLFLKLANNQQPVMSGDESANDLAFAKDVVRAGADHEQFKRIIRRYRTREKLDRDDYLDRTFTKACQDLANEVPQSTFPTDDWTVNDSQNSQDIDNQADVIFAPVAPAKPTPPDPDNFSEDYFLNSLEAYEYLYAIKDDPLEFEREKTKLMNAAKKCDMGNLTFKRMYNAFLEKKSQSIARAKTVTPTFVVPGSNPGETLRLEIGDWEITDEGISKFNGSGFLGTGSTMAFPCPVLPVERLVNVDSLIEKVRIIWNRGGRTGGGRWESLTTDRETISSKQQIVSLSNFGLPVTSSSAAAATEFLNDILNLNYMLIPEVRSVSRLGWINQYGFSPYGSGLTFDGSDQYRSMFTAVSTHGDYSTWLTTVRGVREHSLEARIMVASSFAAAIVKPCDCLSFIVHLWSTASGTGKTVASMVAASIWANPDIGRYVQSFNSTMVGLERYAAFCNSMPLIIDELQLAHDRTGKKVTDIYMLAEGAGRTRSNKAGGLDRTSTWATSILTNGESPITRTNDAAGAKNRVINIEIPPGEMVVTDGHATCSVIKRNYGFAGRDFVTMLNNPQCVELARNLFEKNYADLSDFEATEKQAMAAALILTADQLANEWIFNDDITITAQEIASLLLTRGQIDVNERAYQYMLDWVAKNEIRLVDNQNGERFGKIEFGTAYIIASVFNQAVEEAGYSPDGFMSWLKAEKLIRLDGRHMTVKKRIGQTDPRCVALSLTRCEFTNSD